MCETLTKYHLISALFEKKKLPGNMYHLATVDSIEREDGNIHCRNWNVTGRTTSGEEITVFVKTID